jgi:hypothetical protein
MSIRVNQVLVPTTDDAVLSSPSRVLSISAETNTAWTIQLPARTKSGDYKYYQPGVKEHSLSELSRSLEEESIKEAEYRLPAHWMLADDDYLETAPNDFEKAKRSKRIKERDESWAAIEPLVKGHGLDTIARTYGALGPAIADAANRNSMSTQKIRRLLNLYLSSGCQKSALLPRTENCGAKGSERKVNKPTGRPRKPVGKEQSARNNYILTEQDKRRCALGYALTRTGTSISAAYHTANGAYWSTWAVDEHGKQKATLLPPEKRPSQEQFVYWGRKCLGDEIERLVGRPRNTRKANDANRNGGASTDITSAVGINAMFDGTSTDLYLVALQSRNAVLPPMTRLIIKEPISTAVIGVYCDWQPASPNSALKAILAAAQDKHELCARYGIECPEGHWPGILCRTYLADNGELRAAEITEAERVFQFSIEYARTYHGASKGDVESQHRTDHVRVDHTLPGSTKGKKRSRGEDDPRDSAIFNYHEYMQILVRHYFNYNNELVPERAPLEMIQAGVEPTRLNVLKWYRDTHQSAEIKVDIEHLRAHTLDRWPAVIKENGIFLKSRDKARIYHHHRFFSEELLKDARFQHARRTRRAKDVTVRVDSSIDRIWLPTESGIIMLKNVATDSSAVFQACVSDLDEHSKQLLESRRARSDSDEEANFEEVMTRAQMLSKAKAERKKEDIARGGAPSKAERRSNTRENAEEEMEALGAHNPEDMDRKLAAKVEAAKDPPNAAPPPGAVELAMDAFLKDLA